MSRTLLLLITFLVLSNCSTHGTHQPQPVLSSSTGIFSGTITPFRTPISFSLQPSQGSMMLTEEVIHTGGPGQLVRQLRGSSELALREKVRDNGFLFEIGQMRAALYQDGQKAAGKLDASLILEVDSSGQQLAEAIVNDTGSGANGGARDILFTFTEEPAFLSGSVRTGTLAFESDAPLMHTDSISGGFRSYKKGVVAGKTLHASRDAIVVDITGSLNGPNVNMSLFGFAVADAQSGLILVRETKAEGHVIHPQYGRVPLELRSREEFTW